MPKRSRKFGGGWFFIILTLTLLALLGWWQLRDQTGGNGQVGSRAKPPEFTPANSITLSNRTPTRANHPDSPAQITDIPLPVLAPSLPTTGATSALQSPVSSLQSDFPLATNLVELPKPPSRSNPTTAAAELQSATNYPRPVVNILEAQVALARAAISSGSIDGLVGNQTRAALRAFQNQRQLPVTGELDASTRSVLRLETPILTNYLVTSNDLAGLQPLSPSWLGKSQQSALNHETLLELVAEKSHANPSLLRRLNPKINWTNLTDGASIKVPTVSYPTPTGKAAFVQIALSGRTLEAFDADANLLAHFPCSIAQRMEKRPVGELHVAVLAPNPNYTFDPETFPESAEARDIKTKLVLPPGPNNPVGVAWIGLDRPGYGIHGTPNPEQVGRTESHGCFRLANWNADYLLKLVSVGTPVYVLP